MTSTQYNIGLGDNSRNSSKVLKPPGGGTSDLFAPVDVEDSPRKGRNQIASAGPFPASSTDSTPINYKPGNDSHDRLFGPPEPPKSVTKNPLKSSITLGEADKPDSGNNNLQNSESIEEGNLENGNSVVEQTREVKDEPEVEKYYGRTKLDFNQPPKSASYNTNQMPRSLQASGMPRNCVTGDGCQSSDFYSGKSPSTKHRDGNPVTGEGYELSKNGQAIIAPLVNGDTTSPTTTPAPALRGRVPPGGYSSGLW